jgi:hypothetical protein
MDPAGFVRLTTQENVLGNRQTCAQVDLLIDRTDSQVLRVLRRSGLYFHAIKDDFSRIRLVDTCQYFHESRLSRPVFSHQAKDLPSSKGQAYIVQGLDTGKGFTDAFHDEYALIGFRHMRLPVVIISC